MMRKILLTVAITLIFGVGVFGGRGAGAWMRWMITPTAVTLGDRSGLLQRADAEFVLFSLSSCPYCTQARAWLHEHRVPFKELVIDKSASAQRLFDELKEPGVPVLVARDRLIRGFVAGAYADAIVGAGKPRGADAKAAPASQR